MMKQSSLGIVLLLALSVTSGKQVVLVPDFEECTEMCHHLTSGPCQHPDYLNEVCAEKIEVNSTMVCPVGLIECGDRPTRDGPSPAPSSSNTRTSSASVSPVSPNVIFSVEQEAPLALYSTREVDMPYGDYIIELDFTFGSRIPNGALFWISARDMSPNSPNRCCQLGDRAPFVHFVGSGGVRFLSGIPNANSWGFDTADANLVPGQRYNMKFIRDIAADGRTVTALVMVDGNVIGSRTGRADWDISSTVFPNAMVQFGMSHLPFADIFLHTFKISSFPGEDNFW
jgi:hypothetical protein